MYNQVILIGRLTKDPEIKTTETGKAYCNMNIAVPRSFKNSDGTYETDFVRCSMWDVVAKRVNEYCKKGDLIAVRGQLRSNTYIDANEEKKYALDVVAEKITFLCTKAKDTQEEIPG